ncbi:MAG: cytochrome P450 [Micropepsaceae bacterium]
MVASSADVMKVLSKSTTFPVTPYQNSINTFPPPKGLEHFLLADLNPERHDREKEAFKSAMKSGHECRAEIRKHAESLVELVEQRRDGKIDVVKDVAKRLPIKVFATYFGVPTGGGMPEDDMYLHISRIFWALFMNPDKNRTVQLEAVASVELLQKYLDWLVLARKAKVLASSKPPQDVLGKFIWYYGHLESPYRDVFLSQERVVANICGILIGGVVGFVQAIAFIVEVLTKQHIDAWPGAVSAANGDRVDELWGYAREALRFKPQAPGILRGTGASGATLGEVFIPPNNVVLASHQSAMMDEMLVPDPTRFDPTRPDSCYLHFGYGRNRCLAEDLAPVIITEGLRAILRLKKVHRPAGGELKMGEPYPESLVLSYDK